VQAVDDKARGRAVRPPGLNLEILTHLGLYLVRSKLPPRAPPKECRLDSRYSQVPASDDYLHADPE